MNAGFPHLALITHSISAARRPAASHTSFSKYTRLHAMFIRRNERGGAARETREMRSHRARCRRGRGRTRFILLRSALAKEPRLTVITKKIDGMPPKLCACGVRSTSVTPKCPSLSVPCDFFGPAFSLSTYGKLNDDQPEACNVRENPELLRCRPRFQDLFVRSAMRSFPHGKNEGSKILDTDLEIILLGHRNNFVGILKIMGNAAKNFDILATSLSVLHNILIFKKITFLICIQLKF